MFSAYCDECGSEVLLGPRRIRALHHGRDGIVVVFRCWGGHLGTWRTGRKHAPAAAASAQALV